MSNFKYVLDCAIDANKVREAHRATYLSLPRCTKERRALREYTRYQNQREKVFANIRTLWRSRLGQSVTEYEAYCFSCFTNGIDPFASDYKSLFDSSERLSVSAANAFNDWRDSLDRFSLSFDAFDSEDYGMVEVKRHYENEDDTWWCDHCDARHGSDEDRTEVIIRMNGTRPTAYATYCSSADYFYCDYSGNYYCSDNFDSAESDRHDTVCDQYMRASDWYWDNDLDRWTEDDPSSSSIPDWHDGDRSAIGQAVSWMARNPLTDRKYRRYGIEMEVDFNSREEAVSWYEDNSGSDACIERDGSLDDDTGVEIVSPPMALSEWRTGNWYTELLESARAEGAKAWSLRTRYGCHVNVDLRAVTDQQVALFVALVNNMEPLYVLASGRRKVYNGDYTKVTNFDPTERLLGVNQHITMGEKYQPVRVADIADPDRRFAEVRTFGANLRPGAVLEYIELVDATLCYAQYLSTMPYQLDLFDDIPLSAYPIAEAFNDSVNGFLRWLPSEYTALARLLNHRGVVAGMPETLLNNKIAEVISE